MQRDPFNQIYLQLTKSAICSMKTWLPPKEFTQLQPVHSEGDQPWDFFGRNDAKAETPVLWPPHVKSWLIGKDSNAGRDWGKEEKGTTEDEMAGWHHWLDGCEFEWTLGVGDGQGGLVCCNSWGRKESDTTEWLIWSDEFGLHQANTRISRDNELFAGVILWQEVLVKNIELTGCGPYLAHLLRSHIFHWAWHTAATKCHLSL